MKKSRLELVESMIAEGSEDPFVWYARAMELRSLDRLQEALSAYRDVAAKFPDYVPTYLMAGQVAAELDRGADARVLFERGLEAAAAAGDGHAAGELSAALEQLG